MERYRVSERPNWKQQAEAMGFHFHTMNGETYWDESRFYAFTLQEIEDDIEDPSQALHAMCLEAVDYALKHPEWLDLLGIPNAFHTMIHESWQRNDKAIYGRFDFAYDGSGPAKLLEYNADTPTALYEAGYFQWLWMEDLIEAKVLKSETDQFNSIQEKLIESFACLADAHMPLHFAGFSDLVEERQTVAYLEECAQQAGVKTLFLDMRDISLDHEGQFLDQHGITIHRLFKLYPWEDMMLDEFSIYVPNSATRFFEPVWKSILSNKGLLVLLWHLFPHHPNLLPAWFEDGSSPVNPDGSVERFVRKPLFSREGENISFFDAKETVLQTDGAYGHHKSVIQAYHPLAQFEDDTMVIGSWIVNDQACGIGIREDKSAITKDSARFVPHIILP